MPTTSEGTKAITSSVHLRFARPEDLPFILATEAAMSEAGYIGSDARGVHEGWLGDADVAYFLLVAEGKPAGYAIVCGLSTASGSLELKRIAVAAPGRGVGREALRQILRFAFEQKRAHRLRLDVNEDNARARHVYRTVGFVEEGMLREADWFGDRYRSLVLMSMLDREYWDTRAGGAAS
jgi:ribosomal protein S18 acetylase RimI-like enzyme